MMLRGLSGLSGFGEDYKQRVLATRSGSLLGYWMLAESSGTTITDSSGNGRDGTYSNVTLAQPGIGDGRTSVSLNGSTSYGNVFSAGLASAINTAEGTVALWCKVASSGVWTDATARRLVHIQVDSSNRIYISRVATSNRIDCVYLAGGTTKTVALLNLSATDWIHIAMTWSKSGDAHTAYINGVSPGTNTGLGTWSGTVSTALLGALTTVPASVWSGYEQHAALWSAPLTAGEIAGLARVG